MHIGGSSRSRIGLTLVVVTRWRASSWPFHVPARSWPLVVPEAVLSSIVQMYFLIRANYQTARPSATRRAVPVTRQLQQDYLEQYHGRAAQA